MVKGLRSAQPFERLAKPFMPVTLRPMTDYPDDVYAPSSLAQGPVDVDVDQIEANEAVPPGDLSLMSRRLGQRLRSARGTTRSMLKLMN